MSCDLNQPKNLVLRSFIRGGVLAVILLLVAMTTGLTAFAADFSNRIVALSPTQEQGITGIKIEAEKEIGSRYTSYLLSKPPRVVFDFQSTDISAVPALTTLSEHPVREIRVSHYESAAVKSGRIELILAERVPYKVQKVGNFLLVDFTPATNALSETSTDRKVVQAPVEPVSAAVVANAEVTPPVEPVPPAEANLPKEVKEKVSSLNAASGGEKEVISPTKISEIIGSKGEVLVRANNTLDVCKSFVLKNPARFVVDCFGVTEKLISKVARLTGPVKQVRVGNYADKVRFVFEGDGKAIGKMRIFPVVDGLSVRYDDKTPTNVVASTAAKKQTGESPVDVKPVLVEKAPAVGAVPVATKPIVQERAKASPVTVEKVDFKVEDGKSLVLVTLSSSGEVMQPIKDKTLLRFGIKGATITPALRRTIDASAFPSVVRQITPYTVNNRGQYDVRFAVELKGDAPFVLKNDGKLVTLIIENGTYNKHAVAADEKIELPLPATGDMSQSVAMAVTPGYGSSAGKTASEVISNETIKDATDKRYSGQPVSLNFDNIEIRNVLLLIAEVSDTNIIANDDVKGIITLRLNNVPWDQALDVIMESKGLAMEREGSIVRIAPKEVILRRQLDKATMESQINDKSPSVTKAFSLNYGPVDDIAKKIEELLKGSRGTVSPDARTRQIIVTATPSKLKEIEEEIISRLDVPDKQVTIEARIVEANSNFTRDLGVSWGISQQGTANGPFDLNGAMITGGGSFTINPGTQATNTTKPIFNTSAGVGSQFSFGRIGIDSTILDLRLSALEASGYGKIVSTPRITTSNGEQAEISQGTQIPYQSVSEKGTTTEYKDATLKLTVKPIINPDQSMILEIEVSNDSIGTTVATGVGSAPSINTKKAKTKVMVKNGETTVIGGIFIESEIESEAGIPVLRSLPFVGNLFKSSKKSKDKTELMIFITPRIVE